ncbi:MAG TPA: hypothetical protein VFM68_03100 [Candidatus Saccharimonadales bacterium]|nr:hypothetical protein [Candidatus Saccharimonadales bacterium]
MNSNIFKGMDIRGVVGTDLTVATAWDIGKALADWLPTAGSVVISKYGTANQQLVNAIIEGLRLQGRSVVDLGEGDKIVLTEAIIHEGYSGGVLVSHDTMADEVTIELYREEGKLIDSESGLGDIAVLVEAGNFVPAAVKGNLATTA